MKTLRFYLSMLMLALLISGIVYFGSPSNAKAFDKCSEVNVCCVEWYCLDQCATQGEMKQYKDFFYWDGGDCMYGCTQPVGCTQLCFSSRPCGVF